MRTRVEDSLVRVFFTWGLGLEQDCGAGSDVGQLAIVPATAAVAAEAKGTLQDPWSKFCASGEIS
jgi:hypothetical protein